MCVCPSVRPLRFVCLPGTNNLFVPRGTNISQPQGGGQPFFVGGGGGHDDVDEEMDGS